MRLCESKGQSKGSSKVECIDCALVITVSLMNTKIIYIIVIMERMSLICHFRLYVVVLVYC